jgi:hypothetical protein
MSFAMRTAECRQRVGQLVHEDAAAALAFGRHRAPARHAELDLESCRNTTAGDRGMPRLIHLPLYVGERLMHVIAHLCLLPLRFVGALGWECHRSPEPSAVTRLRLASVGAGSSAGPGLSVRHGHAGTHLTQ